MGRGRCPVEQKKLQKGKRGCCDVGWSVLWGFAIDQAAKSGGSLISDAKVPNVIADVPLRSLSEDSRCLMLQSEAAAPSKTIRPRKQAGMIECRIIRAGLRVGAFSLRPCHLSSSFAFAPICKS